MTKGPTYVQSTHCSSSQRMLDDCLAAWLTARKISTSLAIPCTPCRCVSRSICLVYYAVAVWTSRYWLLEAVRVFIAGSRFSEPQCSRTWAVMVAPLSTISYPRLNKQLPTSDINPLVMDWYQLIEDNSYPKTGVLIYSLDATVCVADINCVGTYYWLLFIFSFWFLLLWCCSYTESSSVWRLVSRLWYLSDTYTLYAWLLWWSLIICLFHGFSIKLK